MNIRWKLAALLCVSMLPCMLIGADRTWDSGGDGTSWHDPLNWDGDTLPQAGDDVTINSPSDPTVVLSTGTHSINSLLSEEAFTLSGGELEVMGTIQVNNSFMMSGGTLKDATVLAGTGNTQVSIRGDSTLDGVTVNGDVELRSNNSMLTITNGLTLNGELELGYLSSSTALRFSGSQAITGNGGVAFWSSSTNAIFGALDNSTLTIGPGITISGSGGTIGQYAESPWFGGTNISIINQGLISATGNGSILVIRADEFTNLGGLHSAIHSSVIHLDVPMMTSAQLGQLKPSSGAIRLPELLDNRNDEIRLDTTTGNVKFESGRILGGTISTSDERYLEIVGRSLILDGVTFEGDMEVTSNNSMVTITNGLTINGDLKLGFFSGAASALRFSGSQAITGNGGVAFWSSSTNAIFGALDNTLLTIGPGITIEGSGGTIGQYSDPPWSGGTNISIINQGVISSPSLFGGRMSILAYNLYNHGIIRVPYLGRILLGRDFVQSSLGTLELTVGGSDQGMIGQLNVGEWAFFDGRLLIRLDNLYRPSPDLIYRVISYGNNAGIFSTIDGLFHESGGLERIRVAWIPTFGTDGLDLIDGTPKIAVQPQAQSTTVGEFVFLETLPAEPGPFQFQWRLNGANLTGETNSILVLGNITLQQAGRYSAAVSNPFGSVITDSAVVTVAADTIPSSDNFGEGTVIRSDFLQGIFSNLNAGQEPNEPSHSGYIGVKSVWLNWTPTNSGIATIDLEGSDFDTVLAVYAGTNLTSIEKIASNDDRPKEHPSPTGSTSRYTSFLRFEAIAGTAYHIVVDGFGGASGGIVVTMNLDVNATGIPTIVTQPVSESVRIGQTARMTVIADGTISVAYQWYANGTPIAGATSATHEIVQFSDANVGHYFVRVVGEFSNHLDSDLVSLERGTGSNIVSVDKFQQLTSRDGVAQTRGSPNLDGNASFGILGTQVFSTFYSGTEQGQTLVGPVIGGSSRWFPITILEPQIPTNSFLVVDTTGSDFDTLLSLYQGTNQASFRHIGTDDNGAGDGKRSLIKTEITNGVYYAAIDGVGGETGLVTLNWLLDIPPALKLDSREFDIREGALTILSIGEDLKDGLTYQWYVNGELIPGAVQESLTIRQSNLGDSGRYSVIVRNRIGEQRLEIGNLLVKETIWLREIDWAPDNGFHVRVNVPDDSTYIVEYSTNLHEWHRFEEYLSVDEELTFSDDASDQTPRKFFRIIKE